MADCPVPLCSERAFTKGPFQDLVAGLDGSTLQDFLVEGTRLCETETGRRLAPFTLTETQRADMVDPDEYADSAGLPMDIQSTLGMSYASAMGASSLVRHCWVDQYAPHYQDMWQYTDVSVTIIRSYGGTQQIATTQVLNGPEPDTGHLWFQLGLFLPIGSRVQITYGGGYQPDVPADLRRAAKLMTASVMVRELNPEENNHDPDLLYQDAMKILMSYMRG